jgi:tRNA A-37 threonylcarbamoyl transferase component Bud32
MSADQGNPRGQNGLPVCLLNGIVVPRDLIETTRHFKMSADQGYSRSQNNCARCLQNRRGVAQNLSETARYYKMSADQGDASGQLGYASCLENGWGIAQDFTEAVKYYKLSADEGNGLAQQKYGVFLENGWGVSKDLSEAAWYYKMAMEQNIDGAGEGIDRCIAAGGSLNLRPRRSTSELVLDLSCYKKVKVLGQGHFGTVQLVENVTRRERFAVKEISVSPPFDQSRLFREIEILASLNHPCIINIMGYSLPSKDHQFACIATEFAANGSLEDILERIRAGNAPGFWTHENISCILIGLVLGMRYVHSQDIIHRDLKPGNLLIDERCRVRICDFGTAIFTDAGTTKAVGTLCYIAPETLNDEQPTKKVDVFAFGLILYELLTGERVFPKDANAARICRLQTDNVRPPIPDFIDGHIAELIRQCWSLNPDERPTFREIYDRLEEAGFPFFSDVSHQAVTEYVAAVRIQESANNQSKSS